MHSLVLYCKSYDKDVERAKTLLESVVKFNIDNIPFYISVPTKDMELFHSVLGTEGYTLVPDEDIDIKDEGWKGQQIIKSQFWKLGLCENYICIDSDCFFIKDFHSTDFMFDEDTPYTVCHEYKSFFEFMDKFPLNFDPYESFAKERLEIMNLFGRDGVIYDFGPGPTIWSAKVWKNLEEEYMIPNNLTFTDLISANGSEFTWYGEWLLHSQVIRLMPKGPLFKNYHYPHQYEFDKQHKYTTNIIAKRYLGLGLQSIYNFNL
tara:strand:- start:2364 stop:3149 length:786 start_codon:yes stop_codon:yes gene_type:complete